MFVKKSEIEELQRSLALNLEEKEKIKKELKGYKINYELLEDENRELRIKVNQLMGQIKRLQGVRTGRPRVDISYNEILELQRKGYGKRKIARELGCSPGTITNIILRNA